jgi:rSAM-associated Gly-rich repeat protein
MSHSDRRRFLKQLLGALAGTAGTVVLATTSTPKAAAGQAASQAATQSDSQSPDVSKLDIQQRAEQLANAAGTQEQEVPISAFLNGAFRNAAGGGFRNAGGGGGAFRNGGFANGGGGGFRNGGFANGAGGGFRNGAFRNI